jgi:hypothetical protein
MNDITIKYKSNSFLPISIGNALKQMEKNILNSKYENDKIICHIGQFKYDLIKFLSTNGIMEKEETNEKL